MGNDKIFDVGADRLMSDSEIGSSRVNTQSIFQIPGGLETGPTV